jgi:acyl dehydratase
MRRTLHPCRQAREESTVVIGESFRRLAMRRPREDDARFHRPLGAGEDVETGGQVVAADLPASGIGVLVQLVN